MSIIDIIIAVILIYAIYRGMREGIIVQACSLMGLVLGLYFGAKYCNHAAATVGIDGEYSSVWGFVIVVVATVLGVTLAAMLARKLFRVVGLGPLDVVLGATLSLCKYLLVLSVIFASFDMANNKFKFIDDAPIAESKLFRPIAKLTVWITPVWRWTEKQVANTHEVLDSLTDGEK